MNDKKEEESIESLRFLMGDFLMSVFQMSIETGDVYLIGEDLQKIIDKLCLPPLKCEECGKKMSFFDYHLGQGLCSDCTAKFVGEVGVLDKDGSRMFEDTL